MGNSTIINGQVITASGNEVAGHVVATSTVGIQLSATAVAGTTPSATFSLQWSDDGTTWSPTSPVDAFAAITAVGSVVQQFTVKAQLFRLAWAVSGTTPSFTVTAFSYS